MTWRHCAIAGLLLIAETVLGAEELVLFDASEEGESAWVAEQAQVTEKMRDFLVREDNPTDTYGSVYTKSRYVFVPSASLEINVKQVIAGTYTIQVLAIKDDKVIHTSDVIKGSTQTGKKKVPLKFIGLPAETESVAFKIWVADADSAATRFRDLNYIVDVEPDNVLLDDSFTPPTGWRAFDTVIMGDAKGARVTLKPDFTFGAIESEKRVKWPESGFLYLDTAAVENGSTSVQLVVFDTDGNYLESIDVISNVFAGRHSVGFDAVSRPAGAASFSVKLWIGGGPRVAATYSRLMVISASDGN